jgi:hypothetical protein
MSNEIAVRPKPIDHVSGKWLQYREMAANYADLGRRLKRLETELRNEVGDAVAATIFGEVVVTYQPIDRFRTTQFADDNPVLYKEFTRPRLVDFFDVEAFKEAHPNLYSQYQSRQWRPKDV